MELCYAYFPNMQALHPETTVQVYREYKQNDNIVKVTIFYREPGKEKHRIDAELDYNVLDPAIEAGPKDIKIIKWAKVNEE